MRGGGLCGVVSSALCTAVLLATPLRAAVVGESARTIPVVHDVDVVVVGGSTAGVAAALKAKEAGASVFVAAPRPYLGEDLCATHRLWLEPHEKPATPLARKLFDDAHRLRGLPFSYTADPPSAERHKDSDPPAKLADGQWNNACF